MNVPPELKRDHRECSLEQWLSKMLRGLPACPAPRTLQARVLAELARRAALPWWRRSFRHWPALVCTAFVAVCGALIGLTALGSTWALLQVAGLPAADAPPVRWARNLAVLARAGTDLAASLGQALPLTWLYGVLSFALALYVVLFMLGAMAYRMLRVQGDRP